MNKDDYDKSDLFTCSLVINRTMAYICTPHVPKFPGAGKISILGLIDVSGELC
jgi:hypothetical protein